MRKWWVFGGLIILAIIAMWLLRSDETPRALTPDDAINKSGALNPTDQVR